MAPTGNSALTHGPNGECTRHPVMRSAAALCVAAGRTALAKRKLLALTKAAPAGGLAELVSGNVRRHPRFPPKRGL
ncbi:hypothetical protein SBA3_30013 [Candidatus Sulfopaludibacter sp. SbA3]|nr:hypothetical protein SBA3_30013 [Candidatus Sulfopaludibacter sp. SbA3]